MQSNCIGNTRCYPFPGFLAGVWLGLMAVSSVFGQAVPPITVDLEFQEHAQPLGNYTVQAGSALPPASIKKLPEVKGALRTAKLSLGGEQLAYALDFTGQKLHLDLNRNGDFTDDPEGVFTGVKRGSELLFTNLVLQHQSGGGTWRSLYDISFFSYSYSYDRPTLRARSFYQGRVTIGGKEYQIGIVRPYHYGGDLFAGSQLLLRAWDARAQPIKLNDGVPEAIPLPRQLFYQGALFQIKGPFWATNNGQWRLELLPQPLPRLGELVVQGSYVHRLILDRSPELAVVLDEPSGLVRVPVGTYGGQRSWLRQGQSDAFSKATYPAPPPLTIREDQSTAFAAGGPLSNLVQITTRGTSLQLNYQLVGAGGRQFLLAAQDRTQPPQFTVYQGDRKVHSGRFEFG